MYQPIYRRRKPTLRLALIAVLTTVMLAASVATTLAAPTDPPDGSFHAAAHLNPPPQECATYSLYNAHLAFRTGGVPNGDTFTTHSDPSPLSSTFQWGENGAGTFNPQSPLTASTPCTTGPGASEKGFTGTLTLTGPARVCTLQGGSYKRTDTQVEYDFTSVTGTGCPAASVASPFKVNAEVLVLASFNPPLVIPPGIEIYDLTACNSVIAPTSCVLTKATHS